MTTERDGERYRLASWRTEMKDLEYVRSLYALAFLDQYYERSGCCLQTTKNVQQGQHFSDQHICNMRSCFSLGVFHYFKHSNVYTTHASTRSSPAALKNVFLETITHEMPHCHHLQSACKQRVQISTLWNWSQICLFDTTKPIYICFSDFSQILPCCWKSWHLTHKVSLAQVLWCTGFSLKGHILIQTLILSLT